MTVLEWIALFVLFAVVGWVLGKMFKPRTFFQRRMVGIAGFLIAFFIIYTVSEVLFWLGFDK